MKSFLLVLTAVVLGCALTTNAKAADPCNQPTSAPCGFQYSLFDGKSLAGWTVENGCEVTVENGVILLKAGDGWLRSDHTYGDFKLHIEWKALQETKYDAGLYLRASAEGKPFPKPAYQVNMLQGKEGNIGGIAGAVSTGLAHPAGHWNVFDVTVVGDEVWTSINGQQAYHASGLKIPRGHVGLQVEVPQGGQFEVRNISITEFHTRSLFNKIDLAGWEGAGGPASDCWEVVEGNLQCTGKKGPWLRSREEFGDFNLRFDYQVSDAGNSGIYVRVPKNGTHHRDDDTLPPAGFEVQVLDDAAAKYRKLKPYQYCGSVYAIAPATKQVCKPAGEWNTMEINCKGNHITTIHNGVTIVDANEDTVPALKLRKQSGYLGLQNHSSIVKFRRLRIAPAVE